MRFRLTPQNKEFFVLYSRASQNVVEQARLLSELLERYPSGGVDLIGKIKEHEHAGDRLTHEIVGGLNRTFVTPFDRDDMYRLAAALDDICDFIDEVADDIALYGVAEVPERARAQADVIYRAAAQLDQAVACLDGFRNADAQLLELRSLEDEGDRLVREAVAQLFRSGEDAISVIRWKDIHERLEEAVDALQSAADVLEAILVKNR